RVGRVRPPVAPVLARQGRGYVRRRLTAYDVCTSRFGTPDGRSPDAEPAGSRSTRAMSSEAPAGSGGPPEDDPFRKQPPPGQGSGSPYDAPGGGGQPPPHGGDPYGGGQYPTDPLAGMPPLADSGRRTLARIIDLILVGIVVWLLTWAFNVH